jgi:hypothetical protein
LPKATGFCSSAEKKAKIQLRGTNIQMTAANVPEN